MYINGIGVYMRITLSESEFQALYKSLNGRNASMQKLLLERKQAFEESKAIEPLQEGREARTNEAKGKIQQAVEQLQRDGKPLTYRAVALASGVHWSTVKKHGFIGEQIELFPT